MPHKPAMQDEPHASPLQRKRRAATRRHFRYRDTSSESDEGVQQVSKRASKGRRLVNYKTTGEESEGERQDDPALENPNKVDMQYLSKSEKVKRYHFDNVASASHRTGFSTEILQEVCKAGGGFVGGSWFNFYRDGAPKKQRKFFMPKEFDLSTLRPLKAGQLSGWFSVFVELVSKVTGQTLVVFPSAQVAAVALSISETQVLLACDFFGTTQQYDFRSYMLRYGLNKPTVYVYGMSHFDFIRVKESHEDRRSRFERDKEKVIQALPSTVARLPETGRGQPEETGQSREQTVDGAVAPRKTFWEAMNSCPTFLHPTLKPTGDYIPQQMRKLCIFCQKRNATILFEPCGHHIACQSCSSWVCKKFCPYCRCKIVGRWPSTNGSMPEYSRHTADLSARPTVYSVYEFMDDIY